MTFIIAPAPTSESIFFDIILESTYWDQPPRVEVVIDNKSIAKYTVDTAEFHIRFRQEMNFDQPHVLELRRTGKTPDQTRMLSNGQYETQMLHIKKIMIDNINLRNLVWHTCRFEPEYPEPWASQQTAQGITLENSVVGEMYLGHNGIWRFDFTSPIYKFLVAWAKGNQ